MGVSLALTGPDHLLGLGLVLLAMWLRDCIVPGWEAASSGVTAAWVGGAVVGQSGGTWRQRQILGASEQV